MPHRKKSYVEHVAIRVSDIGWHIRFFRDVLGMDLREIDGAADQPRQVWTIGGVQLISDPHFSGPQGRLAHIGIMTEDQEAVLREAEKWDVKTMPAGPHWLALPDGICLEILQARGVAVAMALSVNPRG